MATGDDDQQEPARSRSAFVRWATGNYQRLRGFARQLRPGHSEDLVQDFFVRALGQSSAYVRGIHRYTAFAFVAMRNLFLNKLRKDGRARPLLDADELPHPTADGEATITALQDQEDQELLQRTVAYLSEEEQTWLACIKEDMKSPELGARFGCSADAARQRRKSILDRIRSGVRRLRQVSAAGHAPDSLLEQIVGLRHIRRLRPDEIATKKGCSVELIEQLLATFDEEAPPEKGNDLDDT